MAFFADNNSDASSHSDESEESQKGMDNRRMLADELFDSDSDADEKRVVLTEKEKRFNKLKEAINNIRQNTERQNFTEVEKEFDTLMKDYTKSKKVIDQSGIPSFFVRAIYRLEDRIKNIKKEDVKLSQANSKSMNAISRKILKCAAEIKEELKKFSENPTPTTDEGSDKTDSDFNDDSSEDSIHPLESNDPMVRRNFWLLKKKKDDSDKEESDGEKEKERPKKEKKVHEFKVADVEQEREIQIDLTYEGRTAILKEFVANRTQKHFDLKYTYQILKAYISHYLSQGKKADDEIIVEIIMILIPITVDYSKKLQSSSSNSSTCMNRDMWQDTYRNIQELLRIMSEPENRKIQYNTYSKQEDNKFYVQQNVIESISTFFCTIVVELNKSFQNIEASSEEQYNRIKDLYNLLRLGEQIQNFYESLDMVQITTRIAFLRLENMYYIHDSILSKIRESFKDQNIEKGSYFHPDTNTERVIHSLATLVYKYDEVNRTRATLYHIYHHSIHDRAQIGRDYLLMSKITDNVNNIDSILQTYYNRVLVQLGLAYFRQGNFLETFNFLNDLCSASGKIKELIGQAQLRYLSQNDKKKVLPQHQHINAEMIEIVNFVCSMLIEGPIIVQESHNKNQIARNFRRLLDSYNRSHFISTPENSRDYIFFATKELQKGNWEECFDYLLKINIWKHMTEQKKTLENLLLRVKEQSFKSYLFQFKNTFENLSLNRLVEKFQLDSQSIKSITFKVNQFFTIIFLKQIQMISAQELNARVHTIDNQLYIIFEHSDRTSLQGLSNKLIESINQSQIQNQRILDRKIGNREQQQNQEEQNENPNKPQYQQYQQQNRDYKTAKKKLNIAKPPMKKKKY